MLHHDLLVVPGYQGSGTGHWQTWMEEQLPRARRAIGIDWDEPVLEHWVDGILCNLRKPAEPCWIVAHSFGCLAGVVAADRAPDRIAGVFLVAPADPERFNPTGVRREPYEEASLADFLPHRRLRQLGVVVSSNDDPWVSASVAAQWARRWGLRFTNIGNAGHINVASGFGPWPQGIEMLAGLDMVSDPIGAG